MIRRSKTAAQERVKMMRDDWKWVPHPTQKEWLLAVADVKVAACGRRWGKTEAAAYDAATFAVKNPNSVKMIVSPTYDQSRLIFGTVERLMLDNETHRAKTKIVKTPYPVLTYGDGSKIMARTADEDGRNLRGHSADRVIVDEAAYVRDAVIDEVISPMLADRNGQLILISTPFGKNHFYRAFIRGQEADGRYKSFRFPSWDNPHISRDYIESQREVVTERQFTVEYEAEFLDDQNSVFKWAEIQAAVDLGRGCQGTGGVIKPYLVAGVDWARYSDYTAVVILNISEVPYKVVHVDRFNHQTWQEMVGRVIETIRSFGVSYVLTDQTGVGDATYEMMRDRLYGLDSNVAVEGFGFTNQSKREIIDNLGILLSCRKLALTNNEKLIKELQFYEYELTESGNIRMNARRGYTDDLVCALALACQAVRCAPGEFRVMTGGKREWR